MPPCQFLFSAVFGFRKAVLQISSELDETNCHVPIFPTRPRSQKGKSRGGPWAPPHASARLGPQARREVRREPRTSTDIAPSPIYCLRRENPKKRSHISRRVPQRRRHRRQVSVDRISVPARRRDRELPPEPSPSTPSPSSSPLLTPMMRRE